MPQSDSKALLRLAAALAAALALMACGGPAAPTAVATPIPTGAMEIFPPPDASPTAPQATPTAAAADVIAAPTEQPDAGPLGDQAQQLRMVNKVSELVTTTYVDPALNGLDWPAEQRRLRALVERGVSDARLHAELRISIDKLGDGHSNFIPAGEVALRRADDRLGTDVVPAADGQAAVITHVAPGSPAERAGLKPHDKIWSVDGASPLRAGGRVDPLLRFGGLPQTLTLDVQSPNAARRTVAVERGPAGDDVRTRGRLLKPGSGYMLIMDMERSGVAEEVRQTLKQLVDQNGGPLTGLILDLRVNGGGDFSNLEGLLALFTHGVIGQFVTRDALTLPVEIAAAPEGNSQVVPLLLLTSRHTNSYADVLCGALQANGRARLVGQPTAGNIETVFNTALEDGSVLYLAEQRFQLPDGRSWEGRGAQPDIRVDANWEDYAEDDDPVLAAALQALP